MYLEGEIENGDFIIVAKDSSGYTAETVLTDDLDSVIASWERDYGLEGFTFEIFEITLTPRQFNIIPPTPPRIMLI